MHTAGLWNTTKKKLFAFYCNAKTFVYVYFLIVSIHFLFRWLSQSLALRGAVLLLSNSASSVNNYYISTFLHMTHFLSFLFFFKPMFFFRCFYFFLFTIFTQCVKCATNFHSKHSKVALYTKLLATSFQAVDDTDANTRHFFHWLKHPHLAPASICDRQRQSEWKEAFNKITFATKIK